MSKLAYHFSSRTNIRYSQLLLEFFGSLLFDHFKFRRIMHYMLLSTLFTCLLVSCGAIPQTFKANVKRSGVDNSNDSDSPASLDLWAIDESVLFRRNTEESEVGPDEQTANDDDVFADRAEVIAVNTCLIDTLFSETFYASQLISVIIDEYKGERPVRRSSCEVVASGIYERKEVEMTPVRARCMNRFPSLLVFYFFLLSSMKRLIILGCIYMS